MPAHEPHFEALNFAMDFFLMKLPENIGAYRPLKVKISKKKWQKLHIFYEVLMILAYQIYKHAYGTPSSRWPDRRGQIIAMINRNRSKYEKFLAIVIFWGYIQAKSSIPNLSHISRLWILKWMSWSHATNEGYRPMITEISTSLIFHDPKSSQFQFEILRKAGGFNYHSEMSIWSFKIRHLRQLNQQKSKRFTYSQTNTSI